MITKKISNWSIIIGFAIVTLIIWNRIFRYRESYGFDEIIISKLRIFLIGIIIMSFSILLISSIMKVTKYEYKSDPDGFLNRYLEANPDIKDQVDTKGIPLVTLLAQ